MTFLKCVLTGLGAAFGASLIWLLGVIVLPLLPLMLSSSSSGSGGLGFVTGSLWPWPIPILPLLAFGAGFCWKYRKMTRPAARVGSG
jgi:hypothetical protein